MVAIENLFRIQIQIPKGQFILQVRNNGCAGADFRAPGPFQGHDRGWLGKPDDGSTFSVELRISLVWKP